MATRQNLIGLGMPHLLAARVGIHVAAVTCAGTSAGSATNIQGGNLLLYVNASNSGSGIALPQVGGFGAGKGALLGDAVTIANILGATVYIYANANAAGSAVTLYGDGASTAGTTGVSLQTGLMGTFQPITVSTWVFMRAPVSA